MSARRWCRSVGTVLVASLSLVLAGCGAGGFGGDAPEAPRAEPIRSYVALGDGFAAAPYVGRTDRARGCLRSADSYPQRVARQLKAELTDVTCTGATTEAVLKPAATFNGKATLAAQLDAVTPETDLVTITVGMSNNNLLFRGFFVCMALPCTGRINPQDLADEADAAGSAVSEIVRAVTTKAPDAFVVIVGYPQIVPEKDPCKKLPPLDDAQLTGVAAVFFYVNRGLQAAARATGTEYVDLATASEGHNACASDPWVRGSVTKPTDRISFHPLGPAQKTAADLVLQAVQER